MSDTLVHRALRLTDAPAVTELLGAIEAADPVDENFNEQEITEELTSPGVDLADASVAVLDGERLVGFGLLRISWSEPVQAAPDRTVEQAWKAYQWAGVHPAYNGRGIGRDLVADLERAAVTVRNRDAAGHPGELKVWVEQDRPRTLALLTTAGYQTWRYFFRMQRNLRDGTGADSTTATEPTQAASDRLNPLSTNSFQVRPYRPADDDEVRRVSNESFADHWGSSPLDPQRWRAAFAESVSFRPEQSVVAVIEGRIVGFVLTAEFEADSAGRGFRTGYLSMVGTLREARGRGIAGAMMEATVRSLTMAGFRVAELEVDAESPTGAGRLYERAGFTTVGRNLVVGKTF